MNLAPGITSCTKVGKMIKPAHNVGYRGSGTQATSNSANYNSAKAVASCK